MDVTVISQTRSEDLAETNFYPPGFREHLIPKEQIHDLLEVEVSKVLRSGDRFPLVCSLAARYPTSYHEWFLKLQRDADIIVHDSPYLLEYDFLFGLDGRPRIYRSRDVQSDFIAHARQGATAKAFVRHVADLESRLLDGCDLCVVASETDADRFIQRFAVPREKLSFDADWISLLDIRRPETAATRHRSPRVLFSQNAHPEIPDAVTLHRPSSRPLAESIVARPDASKVEARVKSRKRLLVLNDFSVANPTSGGEMRINRLYTAISEFCDVTLLCFASGPEIQWHQITKTFLEIGLPKTREHVEAERKVNRQFRFSASDIVSYLHGPQNSLMAGTGTAFIELCDAVVLTHPYMAGLVDNLNNKPLIYESLNVEQDLKHALLRGHPAFHRLIMAVRECESKAIAKSQIIIAVSDEDRSRIIELSDDSKPTFTVTNGVDVPPADDTPVAPESIKELFQGRPLILFIGSAHPPNVAACHYICKDLAPSLPGCLFCLVGSVCEAVTGQPPSNVLLAGRMDEALKDILISVADIGINPMTSGSGSNLKLAEYFAKRLPCITTPFGARGYSVINNAEAVVCDLASFGAEIVRLLNDPKRQREMAGEAYRYAQKSLDWKILAEDFRRILENEVFERAPHDGHWQASFR